MQLALNILLNFLLLHPSYGYFYTSNSTKLEVFTTSVRGRRGSGIASVSCDPQENMNNRPGSLGCRFNGCVILRIRVLGLRESGSDKEK